MELSRLNKTVCRVFVVLLTVLILPLTLANVRAQVATQQQHDHSHDSNESLGQVTFATSCSPEAQKQFNRAVALLHSFWYEESANAFNQVEVTDASCAISHWGVAMSYYHPIWAPPDEKDLKLGAVAAERARMIPAKTQREKDYIDAINVFYKDAATLDHRTRSLAYLAAMEKVYLTYPADREASIFYALSLLGTALPTDKTYTNQKKAADILNRVLPVEPRHPGVAHYIIHSFDYPQLAELALPAARSYAKIAPSSPHALHMPSHIFTRLGLWQESIQSNIASAESAKKHVSRTHPGYASFDQLHAMDYLEYAYLQTGQDAIAKKVLDETNEVSKVEVENFAAAFALAAIPARHSLERRRWSEAASLKLHPQLFPWDRFRYAEAMIYFARAIGNARNGNPAKALADVEMLVAIRDGLREKDAYWSGQVEIMRLEAAAWTANAEGRKDEAVKLLRAASDLEDSTEKHPVTPGAIVPAREMLGDLFLAVNQPSSALTEFEKSLQSAPNRFNGVYGAARSAELAGHADKARKYYGQLVALSDRLATRPELQTARRYLARNKPSGS